jgi:DNA integrity scanning protein DisA with diadenylate cyclase activity
MTNFWYALFSLRWQDIFDIALNSYILFRFYILFRGTRSIRAMFSIALLWIFYRVATAMGLILTSWVIQGITALAALIIVIVFRNEFRAVFQTATIKNVLWGIPRQAVDTPVEMVAAAAFQLARDHIGALIVIQGKQSLQGLIRNSIPWQGVLSKEMLLSIFWHGNPVHDGAAVIQGRFVREVGAILPLSDRRDLPSHYGTRHRAAAGLTEQNDALVLVISEERGDVVAVKGAHFEEVQKEEMLRQTITDHLGASPEKDGASRREALRLGAAAALSLIFVTGIWFTIARGKDTLITLKVPIEFLNQREDMDIQETSINTVELQLEGSEILMNSLRAEQVRVRLDLSSAEPGLNSLQILAENVTLPPGILLKKIEPMSVEISLDMPMKKVVPIQVDWSGKLVNHLAITAVRLKPDRIELTGGKRILENLSTVYTEKIPLDKIEKSGEIKANLILNPPTLRPQPEFNGVVTVAYQVAEREE